MPVTPTSTFAFATLCATLVMLVTFGLLLAHCRRRRQGSRLLAPSPAV